MGSEVVETLVLVDSVGLAGLAGPGAEIEAAERVS